MKIQLLLILMLPFLVFAQKNNKSTALEIVDLIQEKVTCEWSEKTVDTFKAGKPETKVNGIICCMFADMEILKTAVELNCNFIITHEPVFYNHLDKVEGLKNDAVYEDKARFIEKNGLVIFRFHDHIHRTQPDGIYEGMINKLNWKNSAVDGSQTLFRFPETSLNKFARQIKNKLEMKSIRVIGNPDMKFTKVGFAAGAPGGQKHIQMLQSSKIEVLVAGEAPEWETYLYANDAVQQNRNKAVIFLGHIKSEEAGMEYCAGWLKKFIHNIPVYFIENKANFRTL